MNSESAIITKREALKILRERTGKKYGPGIFCKGYRRDRIFATSRFVFRSDLERFLLEREKRLVESPEDKFKRSLSRIQTDCFNLSDRAEHLAARRGLNREQTAALCAVKNLLLLAGAKLHYARHQESPEAK